MVHIPELSQSGIPLTLSCEAVDRAAIRYFFNDLLTEDREAIQTHLRGCSRCRKKLEAFERVWLHDDLTRGAERV